MVAASERSSECGEGVHPLLPKTHCTAALFLHYIALPCNVTTLSCILLSTDCCCCCIVVRNIKDTLASDSYWALSHTSPCHVNFHRPLMKRPSFYQTEQLSSCAIPNQLSRGVSLYIDKQKSTCASAALLNIAWTRCCQ